MLRLQQNWAIKSMKLQWEYCRGKQLSLKHVNFIGLTRCPDNTSFSQSARSFSEVLENKTTKHYHTVTQQKLYIQTCRPRGGDKKQSNMSNKRQNNIKTEESIYYCYKYEM